MTQRIQFGGRLVPLEVLQQHWLHAIECDHEKKVDRPICACSQVDLGWHATVGAAVDAWLQHVAQASGPAFHATGRLDEHPLLLQAYALNRDVDTLPAHPDQTALITQLGDWRARLYAHLAKHNLLTKKEV